MDYYNMPPEEYYSIHGTLRKDHTESLLDKALLTDAAEDAIGYLQEASGSFPDEVLPTRWPLSGHRFYNITPEISCE